MDKKIISIGNLHDAVGILDSLDIIVWDGEDYVLNEEKLEQHKQFKNQVSDLECRLAEAEKERDTLQMVCNSVEAQIKKDVTRFMEEQKRADDVESRLRTGSEELDNPPMYFAALDCETKEEIDVYPLREVRGFMDRLKAALDGEAESASCTKNEVKE